MPASNDSEIRAALHRKKLRRYRHAPDTLVVEELGLSHAKVRIDVAVINGYIHGYEIKSAVDSLRRLQLQLELYAKCLSRLSLVCAPCHIEKVVSIAPPWCGLVEATKAPCGTILFATLRRGCASPDLDPVQLAHLLWKHEAALLFSAVSAPLHEN
jgi:hypothetical protein